MPNGGSVSFGATPYHLSREEGTCHGRIGRRISRADLRPTRLPEPAPALQGPDPQAAAPVDITAMLINGRPDLNGPLCNFELRNGGGVTQTGADISHHQASFNPAAYKAAGEDFVILKATESDTFTDPNYKARWAASRAADLPRACYHFARPSRSTAEDQAAYFVKAARAAGWSADDVWALDYECDQTTLRGATLTAWAERWCDQVTAALGGPGLFYSYIPYIKGQMGNPGRVPGGCLAWVARYGPDPYAAPYTKPTGWPDPPDVWQCGDGIHGCVKDVATIGKCDYNRMTDDAFAKLFGGGKEWWED